MSDATGLKYGRGALGVEAMLRLINTGWDVRELTEVTPDGIQLWVVTGARENRRIRGDGRNMEEAWVNALEHARSLERPSRI